jgi:hypothetical protein
MNHLDVYYRALREYRALTLDNRECRVQRNAIAQANTENDKIVITRNICTVDEDWIIEIEKGLIFVEKAINEERQFIYSNGEVVPIEKVKHVSKDSVQHLAKHSNLITKEQTGPDIIPDQIYSVERLNDYAVYENRFLYMLLCYLRDFVTIRYDKILELSNRYDGVLRMDKEVTLPNRKITYTVDLHDVRKDDKYLREHNPSKDVIDRIDLILKTIMAFLSTPLMEIAGKAAKLKPPITKTNVLKMDNNFKGAVALYDFIIAYDKPGYSTESHAHELSPFGEDVADEFSEVGALMTFMVYEHGLGLEEELKNRFELAQEARKAEEIRKKEVQLLHLKKKLANMEISPEEYILALEKQLKLMQNANRQLDPLRDRVAELEQIQQNLEQQVNELQNECNDLNDRMAELKVLHAQELENLKQECNERIHNILTKHEDELRELEQKYNEHLEELQSRMKDREAALTQTIEQTKEQLHQREDELGQLQASYDSLSELQTVNQARIKALMFENGRHFSDDDFTDKQAFDELERELEAFATFFDQRWGKTKKKIRKQLLNYQSLKGQNGQND